MTNEAVVGIIIDDPVTYLSEVGRADDGTIKYPFGIAFKIRLV